MRRLALVSAALPLLFLAGCGASAATGSAPGGQSASSAQPEGDSLAVGDCLHLTPYGPAEYQKVDCSDGSRFLVLGEIPREEGNAAMMDCRAAVPSDTPGLSSKVTEHVSSGDKTYCLTLGT
jgi:hypothetical protein